MFGTNIIKTKPAKAIGKDVSFIFSINSGRSGSEYLSKLLGSANDVVSFHEPRPKMTNEILKLVTCLDYKYSYWLRKIKIKYIRKLLLENNDCCTYAETTHMFIKTFFDVIVKELKNVHVIHLRRKFIHTLTSFIELGYFDKTNHYWHMWLISPNAKTAAITCIDKDCNLDQIDLCIAYLIDMEARAQRFKQQYPHVLTLEYKIEELNNKEIVQNMFKSLNLKMTMETEKFIGKKINRREDLKAAKSEETAASYLDDRIELYISTAKQKGISIPDTLYL